MPTMPAAPSAPDPDALSWQTLPLTGGATMAWCEGGDPAGLPVVVLHGGPGGRTRAPTLGWWQGLPVRWIAYDQRGCGRSTPRGGLQGNDLDTLLQDLERLRQHLGVVRWGVAGGSWGALLAMAHAVQCPQRVAGLFLRSRFTGSEDECRRYMAPWSDWLGPQGRAALGAQGERLQQWVCQGATALCDDGSAVFEQLAQDEALAAAWAGFDGAQSAPGGVCHAAAQRRWQPGGAEPAAADWRVFLHLAGQRFGVGAGGVAVPAVAPGPVWLVHGEADAVCDPASSAALAGAWPAARHVVVPEGAHAMSHPPMAAALQAAARDWVAALQADQVFQRSLR
jgi:proline iminopeptidase